MKLTLYRHCERSEAIHIADGLPPQGEALPRNDAERSNHA